MGIMEARLGGTMKNNKGEEFSMDHINKMQIIGLYFSASWCPPCRAFSEQLIPFYEEANKDGQKLEIVLVPLDQSEEEATEYLKKMPWLTLPFGTPLINKLNQEFQVSGIPTFLLFDTKGNVISEDGRGDLMSKEDPMGEWVKAAQGK